MSSAQATKRSYKVTTQGEGTGFFCPRRRGNAIYHQVFLVQATAPLRAKFEKKKKKKNLRRLVAGPGRLLFRFSLECQPLLLLFQLKVKLKVSYSVIAVWAVGVRVPLYVGHSWWKAEPIPLLLLPYPSLIRKRYPFTAGLTERVFQSSHGEAQPRTHALRRLSVP